MIGYLEGEVKYVVERNLILNVGGVGYEMLPSFSVVEAATEGALLAVFVHTHVREDQLSLFAFKDLKERELFRLMIGVNGIGPKSGMEMLRLSYTEIVQAIAGGDPAILTQVPGVGKKTAERIVIELRDKISLEDLHTSESTVKAPTNIPAINNASMHTFRLEQNYKDIIEALLGLGYDKKAALIVLSRYVEEHPHDGHSEAEVLKYCLQYI